MSYIKVSNQIEALKRFKKSLIKNIQILFLIIPFMKQFGNESFLRVQISITSTISNFQMMPLTIFWMLLKIREPFLRIRPWF